MKIFTKEKDEQIANRLDWKHRTSKTEDGEKRRGRQKKRDKGDDKEISMLSWGYFDRYRSLDDRDFFLSCL